MLEHILELGKIEVLRARARARYRAPNARALLILDYKSKKNVPFLQKMKAVREEMN